MSLLLLLCSPVLAGERIFAFSYGYGTVPKGGVEVEHYATVKGPGAPDAKTWQHQVELEYGLTDRLEGGLYLVAEQPAGGALTFVEYKGRLRYRLGSQGVGPVDVGLYLEYAGTPSFGTHEIEAKVLLAKDVGNFVSALNLEYVVELEGGAIGHKVEPTLGLGYKVAPWFVVGAEAITEVKFGEELEGPFAWAGPSVHLAGEGGRLWWTLAVVAPLTGETAEDEGWTARSLIAINL